VNSQISETQKNALQSILQWLQNQFFQKLRYLLGPLYNGTQMHADLPINLYTLKRNIHRLEKGIIHKNRKPIFAQDFILETIFAYHFCTSQCLMEPLMRGWVEAVLESYFKTVDKSAPMIMEAWAYFEGLNPRNDFPSSQPYSISQRPELNVSYQDFLNLSIRRRSIRHFLEKTVEPDIIKRAITVAAQAPSACNRQAFRFLFFNQPSVVTRIAGITGGVSGYELPAILVIVSDYSAYADVRDIKSPIIDASLAAMSFCLALETLNLSSVCINWPCEVIFDEKLRTIIAIENHESIVMLMGVGYPAADAVIPFSAKKTVDALFSCNERIK
jgi:nitroreductase